jgi:hypothetical protein
MERLDSLGPSWLHVYYFPSLQCASDVSRRKGLDELISYVRILASRREVRDILGPYVRSRLK